MKKRIQVLAILLSMGMVVSMIAATKSSHSEVMTKEADGTYIVNTTTLCKDVKGFRGNTPLLIYIKKGRIIEIKPLANQETPRFFNKVKLGLLNKWKGMRASKSAFAPTDGVTGATCSSKSASAQVDGVTGATYSSKAVKENVKRGIAYYLKHK